LHIRSATFVELPVPQQAPLVCVKYSVTLRLGVDVGFGSMMVAIGLPAAADANPKE
jgi:hypothetical protein